MVAEGTINSHGEQFSSILTSYESCVGDILASWKGDSSNNFETITESFYSDAKAVKNQFTPFANAIKYYRWLEIYKKNVDICRSNYNNHLNDEDATLRNHWSSKVSEYEKLVKDYTEKITALLESVGGLIIEGGTGITEVGSVNATIQAAIDWAVAIANDDSHGYSQSTRHGNPNYDCSSLVTYAYQNAGTGCRDVGANVTSNMRSAMTQVGFEWIPFSEIDSGRVELQPGDVLLDEDQHTEMYIGDGKNVGAHSNYDGVDGDSSGREISVSNYYRGSWDGVLRYTGDDNK